MPLGQQKQAVLLCDCCGGCVGVCFPFSDGALDNLYWEVSAPSCGGIDGATGIFTPVDPTFPTRGRCGYCDCYLNISDLVSLPGIVKFPLGGICFESPCAVALCFALTADIEEEPATGAGLSECCARVRLLVGIEGGNLELGGDGTQAINSNCDEDIVTGPCNGIQTWVELSPISCVCDSESGLSAVFSLESLAITCTDFFSGGDCDGEPTCCTVNCDLTDATVTISTSP